MEPDSEALGRHIGEMAAANDRCPLCLSLVSDGCGWAEANCTRPLATEAEALAILEGYIRG